MGVQNVKEANVPYAIDDMSLGNPGVKETKNQKSPKRKGSDSIAGSSSEQYFNNIAQNKSRSTNQIKDNPTIQQDIPLVKTSSNDSGTQNVTAFKDDAQTNENIQTNNGSALSSPSFLNGPEIDEGYFSHQVQKSSLLSNSSDIDLDMKNVFQGQKKTMRTYTSSRCGSEIDLSGEYKHDIDPTTHSYIATLNQNDYELNFYRNGEEIRRSYIAKLICKKVWTPSQKEKTHNSLIIFDWDDTLLCTSFLTPNGVYDENLKLTEKDKEKIAKLEFSVLRLLSLSLEKGDVYIITNAGPGWVEYSAEKYYPSICKLLKQIVIISARGEYESKFPNDSRMWKFQAFINMQKNFDSDLVTNIICLGDSFIEMQAGHILASKFTQAFIKTVKFRESPKPEELNKQLTLVADQFSGIYAAVKNLTIRVEKKKR